MGRACDRGRLRGVIRRRARSDGWQKRGSSSCGGEVQQGLALLDEVGVAVGLRRPRSALYRDRLLRARLRPAGARTVRRRRGVDRGDGAVVQDERHREPPRALPGPSRGDPQAARIVRRGRERGARSVRGTPPVPATRARMAADRARTDPTSERRHRRRGASVAGRSSSSGGIRSPVSRSSVWPKETSPPPRHPYETRSSTPSRCRRRSCHRTPTCSGRRCSRRRSRSRSLPATSTEPAQPPTS